MKELNKKSILNIILIMSGILIIGLIIYITITIKDIKKISNEIYNQRIELETKYQSGLSLRENIQQLKELEPKITLLREVFIDNTNTLEFINDLEKEAEKRNINQIINIPEVDINKNKITTSAIQLTLSGETSNVLEYINILDTKPYYINISDIQLNNSDQQNKLNPNASITVILNGTIYWK